MKFYVAACLIFFTAPFLGVALGASKTFGMGQPEVMMKALTGAAVLEVLAIMVMLIF